MSKHPKVSVRIPSYNHEKYIRECIDSVLNQTFQDFEIVITDDASTDGTADIIREYRDPRIKLYVFKQNQGCTCAVADCVKRCRGEYIANLCSDDAWEKDKLEKQVAFLEKNPGFGAVFTKVKIIDEDGCDFDNENHFYFRAFDVENRPREQWLRYFFLNGNCLCIPSVMIRREIYQSMHCQDKRMANLADFDLWVRFCMEHELYILDDKLTKFRVRSNEANASGNRLDTQIRSRFEYKQILDNYLQINDINFIKRIFPEYDEFIDKESLTPELIPYLLGKIALSTSRQFQQLWGLETLFKLMGNEEIAELLSDSCGFRYTDLHRIASQTDVYGIGNAMEADKLYGQLQNLQGQIQLMLDSRSWRWTKPLRVFRSMLPRSGEAVK